MNYYFWVLVFSIALFASFSECFLPVNPGLTVGIKSHSDSGIRHFGHHSDSVIRLHPSLTSKIEPRHNVKRRKSKQTNFQDLKATLLKGQYLL